MRGNKKQSIAQSKKYIVIPKKQFKRFLENQTKWSKETLGLRRDMRKLIVEEVARELGDKVHMIESTLKDVMMQRKIFEDKGYITKEEINKKYEELKDRK